MDTPKACRSNCYETNVASLMTKYSTRPVMETVPESRPTSKSPSAAHGSTASYVIKVTSSICLYITANMKLGIM